MVAHSWKLLAALWGGSWAHGVTEDIMTNRNTITTLQIKLFIVKSKIYKITLEIKVALLQVRIDK